jgi:hypothetical protein
VPVERIDLHIHARQAHAHPTKHILEKDRRTWTQDIASSVRSMSDTGKLQITTGDELRKQKTNKKGRIQISRRVEHKPAIRL